VFVVCVHIDSVSSDHPQYRNSGYTPEIDVGLWALVIRTKPLSLIPRWLPLLLFVDSAPAAFIGREVYGFPKQVGRLTVPGTAPASDPFHVQGLVIPTPGSMADWRDVISIRPIPGSEDASVPTWDSLEEAWDGLVSSAREKDGFAGGPYFPDMQHLREALHLGAIPMAFLKQFLDVHDVTRACHQSIVEASADTVRFRRAGFTRSRFELEVRSYYSLPLDTVLGLQSGWKDVGHAMWSDFDFVMGDGDIVWQAGG
jgi:hypothetical protein